MICPSCRNHFIIEGDTPLHICPSCGYQLDDNQLPLSIRAKAYNREMRDNLQLLYDSITAKGQRKKLLENPKVAEMLRKYGVKVEGDA